MNPTRSLKQTKLRLDTPSPRTITFHFCIQRNIDNDHYAVQYFSFLDGTPTCVGTYDSVDHGKKGRPITELFYRVEMTEEEHIILAALSVTELSDEAFMRDDHRPLRPRQLNI